MSADIPQEKRDWAAVVASAALSLIVFVADMRTPLGYAVWAMYLLPVGATLFQRRPWMPFAVAAASSALTVAGFFGSPQGISDQLSIVNRVIGGFSVWVLAVVISQVLATRASVGALLWLRRSESLLSQRLLGSDTAENVADRACAALCELLGAHTAVLYRLEGTTLHRSGGHAFDPTATPPRIEVPDGLAGQVAVDGQLRVLDDVPEGHLPIASALASSTSRQLVIAPVAADGETCGVVELGFMHARQADLDNQRALLERVADPVGVALRSALYRQRQKLLLEQTQRQSEELQMQQEELRVANEELEEQSRGLRESQARLETQQVELEQANVLMEERNEALERHRRELVQTQTILRDHATRLESASRYKSEFLANMSHELRTPLNSSLILSKLLADNREATLTAEQVNFAQAIYASNNDLLTLINDILDLSKIEAGHTEIVPEAVALDSMVERLRATFTPLAQQKTLNFTLDVAPETPDMLVTDPQRLQQVLKNLLANAVKFTQHGDVALHVSSAGDRLLFEVRDSGVGIPKDQQEIIFEAFRQADGSTSRRFGGTGLGLSISRELARRLGGDIRVDSEPGRGSTFTLDIPVLLAVEKDKPPAPSPTPGPAPASAPRPAAAPLMAGASPAGEAPTASPAQPAVAASNDDRAQRQHPDRLILAVEDDVRFARVLYDLAHEMGFDCVIAPTAAEALRLARELKPSGVLLDVGLPDQSGLGVLERLKRDPSTRHIPVHMMSVLDRTQTALELGAVGYVLKPAAREELAGAIERLQERLQHPLRHLLIVEDDEELRENLGLLLRTDQVDITAVGSMAAALDQLAANTFDCMVLDLSLPDGSGYELLEKMAAGDKYSFPPVIVYTGRALDRDEEQRLRRYSKSIIVKGARSPERLLDEVTLFLHSVEATLPVEQQRLLRKARQRDAVLDGRRILLAEDDVRNVFALASVFEPLGAKLDIARNGREAIERLEQAKDIDLVLMDIMMPELDGLTAMKLIREREAWARLPIIALTAKAMPDDREQCLAAGANDYVAKPIDVDKLVSLCRVWMPK
jgi:CheY-like chemotaxis protein